MDYLLAYVTVRLLGMITQVLGPSVDQPVFDAITRADVLAVGCYLLIALTVSFAVLAVIRWRFRRAHAEGYSANGPNPLLSAVRTPAYILIWIYGIYIAATPILLKIKPDEGLVQIRRVLNFLFDLGALVAFFWFVFRATRVVENRLALRVSGSHSKANGLIAQLVGTSLRLVVLLVATIVILPLLGLSGVFADIVAKLTSMLFILSITVVAIRTVAIYQQVVYQRFDISAADNLRARKVHTQIQLIGRVIYVVIAIVATAAVLMLFQQVRHIGTSMLASAGVLGIIAGFAAQKTLANLFAGFQVALAQPVRQDDVVVVEGEWGRVEEITLTNVVVHIWDDRRLVLPLTYFIEKPFQNWTRVSAELLGSVFVWVDYGFSVEDGRLALKSIVENSALWDRRFWNLQVTDATDRSMQLRVLATAADSSKSFDLRCEIREKFIAYIQREQGQALPRLRAMLKDGGDNAVA